MSPDVELGEAGGLAYRSAGSGRPLAASPEGAERLRQRFGGVTYQPGPNRQEEWGEFEPLDALAGITVLAIAGGHDRYWPVVARWLEETAPPP